MIENLENNDQVIASSLDQNPKPYSLMANNIYLDGE